MVSGSIHGPSGGEFPSFSQCDTNELRAQFLTASDYLVVISAEIRDAEEGTLFTDLDDQ